MRRSIVLGGGLVAATVAIAAGFVIGMRRKSPTVLTLVTRLSRAMKPMVLAKAGTMGSNTSIIRHTGRKSGRTYETPVVAAPTDDGFVIALPYGATDWLKNVFAAGRAQVVFDGDTYDVDTPERIAIDDATGHFGRREQRLHKQFDVRDGVRVRTVSLSGRPRHPAAGTA